MVAKENGYVHSKLVGQSHPMFLMMSLITERRDTPPISKYSPYKESLSTSSNGFRVSSLIVRKEALIAMLITPIISPIPSVEIRQKIDMSTQVVSQSSHDSKIDMFCFPDPIEILKAHKLSTQLTL